MKRGAAVTGVTDAVAHFLAMLAKGFRVPLKPCTRMWRLASLRAYAGVQAPVSTQFDGPVTVSGTGNLRLGEQCRLGRDVHFDTADAGQITLGNRVRINAGGTIVATRSISIGDDTLVGEYVSIRDADHGTAIGASPIRSQPLVEAGISIGRDAWIGRGCCILKGVSIADGAVVGANSVVTCDVPPNSIYAGAPAKQIGSRKG